MPITEEHLGLHVEFESLLCPTQSVLVSVEEVEKVRAHLGWLHPDFFAGPGAGLPATRSEIAIACFCGRPSSINFLMFWPIVLFELPCFKGMFYPPEFKGIIIGLVLPAEHRD